MPHGVFLSTGTASSASGFSLFITGFTMVAVGMVSLLPTYVIAWLVDQQARLSLPALLLQVGMPGDAMTAAVARIGVSLLAFFVFLTILRLSPLSGHHAAEHMTVHAIERYGIHGWEDQVAAMPRAHMRCGSNLLSGILPVLMIGMPLSDLQWGWGLTVLVAVIGWRMRHRTGFFLQNAFTTKPPTPGQLARGIAAGRTLLDRWMRSPDPPLPLAQRLWRRGVPQLIAGVICALYVLGMVMDHMHVWLDW